MFFLEIGTGNSDVVKFASSLFPNGTDYYIYIYYGLVKKNGEKNTYNPLQLTRFSGVTNKHT